MLKRTASEPRSLLKVIIMISLHDFLLIDYWFLHVRRASIAFRKLPYLLLDIGSPISVVL